MRNINIKYYYYYYYCYCYCYFIIAIIIIIIIIIIVVVVVVVVIIIIAFDKGERLHSVVAFENFGAFIYTDLAPPKNSSWAKLFRENDVIFIGHVLNLVLRLSLLCLLNEVAMCFVSTRSPVSICLASWCASLFRLTSSSRLVCFLVEFWTLLPCLFYMFTITIA